ncbi:acyl carrier protein [Streptomyces sp. NPDC007983]|uniref:acyl carrier protein n=1 Tax=Streptomyces sp. NPDC007983 TaxID=3364800 RepID=UPI0036E9083C
MISTASSKAIREFIVTTYAPDVSAEELDPSYDLLDNGLVDSLGLLQLISWVGDRYDIDIDDVEIAPDDFRSVNAISAFIEKAKNGGLVQ